MILKTINVWILITICLEGAHCELYNFCENVDHGSYFEYGCCNGTQLDYGIDFQANWKQCTDNIMAEKPETIKETMWKVYGCIVKSAVGKKVSLRAYADAMTGSYPSDLKTRISELVRSRNTDTDLDKNSREYLNWVRLEYHKIEREACTGTSYEKEDWTACKTGKDTRRENQHLRGDCCRGEQIPIRLTFLRRQPSEVSQECTRKTATMGGTIMKYSGFLVIDKSYTYNTGLSYDESDAQIMCLQHCVFTSDFEIQESYAAQDYRYAKLIQKFIGFLPVHVQNRIIRQINETEMNGMADDYVENLLEDLVATEFHRTTDRAHLKTVLRLCEAHNVAVRHIESTLMEVCELE